MQLTEFVDGTVVRVREVSAQATIGRGLGVDYRIAIENTACSRVQATLKKKGSEWVLIDGDGLQPSRNGIWNKGVRISEPLALKEGMSIDVFIAGEDRVILDGIKEQVEPVTAEIPSLTSIDFDSLYAAVKQLQVRAVAGDVRVEGIYDDVQQLKTNGEKVVAFQQSVESRLDLLSTEIRSALDSVQSQNLAQDNQLRDHNVMIKRCCGLLAAFMLGGGIFNASRSPDAAAQAINWVLGIGGIGGGAIAVGTEERRRSAP